MMPGEFDLKIESLVGSCASTECDDAHYYVLVPKNKLRITGSFDKHILSPNINNDEFDKEKCCD